MADMACHPTMNIAASATVGWGLRRLMMIQWHVNSSKGSLYSFLVKSRDGTSQAATKPCLNGALQLGKTSAKKYHHMPMFGEVSGACKAADYLTCRDGVTGMPLCVIIDTTV